MENGNRKSILNRRIVEDRNMVIDDGIGDIGTYISNIV